MRGVGLRGAGKKAGENIDDGPRGDRADRAAFLGERDEERAAAGAGERGRDRLDAEAVAVGLDDGRRLGCRADAAASARQLSASAPRSMVRRPPASVVRR